MRIYNAFLAILRIYKWPIYIIDLYIKYIQQKIWKKRGIKLGKNIRWLGFPILTSLNGSIIKIGENCLICSRSKDTALGVGHPVIIRTLTNKAKISIGNGVRMSGTSICSANSIDIGDRCVIGADVWIVDTDFHSLDPEIRSSLRDSKTANSRPVCIGTDVFIGGGSKILKGVVLENNVVVGAGSIVTKSFPKGSIISGNPAKIVGSIKDE
jgi:acetyltransferase-like isoleucine patch superfamily enzyme